MRKKNEETLSELEAKKKLDRHDILVIEDRVANSGEEALSHAKKIGLPVVLKVNSPDITHKTDIGGVETFHSYEEIEEGYNRIIESVREAKEDTEIDGVLVEKKLKGTELIVGTKKDPDFGQILMFGLGGIFVETLKDINFRPIPISGFDAKELIEELESEELLEGTRGQPEAEMEELKEILLKVSEMVEKNPEIEELDINPLFVTESGIMAADALMKVRK